MNEQHTNIYLIRAIYITLLNINTVSKQFMLMTAEEINEWFIKHNRRSVEARSTAFRHNKWDLYK